METKNKMIVEIWSDIMCPFCYLGKRKFESALSEFPGRENVQVIWKSFQLMPSLQTDTTINIHEFLAREKGFDLQQARQMNSQLTVAGRQVGLEYDFDRAVVANTFNAHRFLHFAKEQGKQNEAEERLFKAYFTEGKNMDDLPTLVDLGTDIGLNPDALLTALQSGAYTDEVNEDIHEAQQLGIRGVPFFVFNRKYAVSGAQETPVFLQTIDKAFSEWRKDVPAAFIETTDGQSCTTDGTCN